MADVEFRIGVLVEPREVSSPPRSALTGRTVTLVPLDPDAHASGLFAATQGPGADPHMWDYLGYGPFADLTAFTTMMRDSAASLDPLWYAIVDAATGAPLGAGTYLRIEPANRVLEIGHLLFGSGMQRSTAATETIFLLIRNAFDLGYRRVEWKCNDLNERSKRAALRFGFSFEGTFRQHMIIKGATPPGSRSRTPNGPRSSARMNHGCCLTTSTSRAISGSDWTRQSANRPKYGRPVNQTRRFARRGTLVVVNCPQAHGRKVMGLP